MPIPYFEGEITGTEQRTWRVSITLPKTAEKPQQYQRNRTFAVACRTFEQAVAATRELFPDAQIWSVTHSEKILIVGLEDK